MKKMIILLLSLTNIVFGKTVEEPGVAKNSFFDQVSSNASTIESDSVNSTDCKGGGDR